MRVTKLNTNEKSRKNQRNVISLFSGAMGLDIGLMQAGLNIVLGQDFDPICVQTMKANGHNALGGDIRTLEPQKVLDICKMKMGEPFIICGGPPCQPFSTAGKRLGISDPRGSLFMDFIRFIDFIRPRFFIMENVKGLVSAPLNDDNVEIPLLSGSPKFLKTALDVVLSEFDKLKYKTVYGILDAVNYGTPQFRERLVLIGSRDGEEVFLPFPTHFQTHQDPQYRWQTLGSVILDLDEPDQEYTKLGTERKRYLHMVPEGGNWRDLPDDIISKAMGGAYESGGGKVGFYRRLSFSQPAPTLTTSPAQKATLLGHPIFDRPLSVQEYARIQQFPDEWTFAGSTVAKYKQIGNAVPTGLGKALGLAVIATADNNGSIETKRFRGTSVHKRIRNVLTMGELT